MHVVHYDPSRWKALNLEGIMKQEEILSLVEEVMEQLEDEDIAENLDVTTRYMPEEEAPSSDW